MKIFTKTTTSTSIQCGRRSGLLVLCCCGAATVQSWCLLLPVGWNRATRTRHSSCGGMMPQSVRKLTHDIAGAAALSLSFDNDNDSATSRSRTNSSSSSSSSYQLGIGKNKPLYGPSPDRDDDDISASPVDYWRSPEGVTKPQHQLSNKTIPASSSPMVAPDEFVVTPDKAKAAMAKACKEAASSPPPHQGSVPTNDHTGHPASPAAAAAAATATTTPMPVTRKTMVARTNEGNVLRKALMENEQFGGGAASRTAHHEPSPLASRDRINGEDNDAQDMDETIYGATNNMPRKPKYFYPDIDLSIPPHVYNATTDLVWDLLRWEAHQEATREPLLVSFMHSTILNHASLESSLAFLLANRLAGPMMISTQLQSIILETLQQNAVVRHALRADLMAVRDRDPACQALPDVFLYFKGFHALQTHRVANVLWQHGKQVLAHYLQSQVSQHFQIDVHPNATLGRGIMLDHGTGIVIGETARIGHNCSILHHVTLGGSGKAGVHRHPQVGNGVLLGAGATLLGPVRIGDGSQVGAGTLVITDLPPHCVAVGVPARIIGSFVDVTSQPSIGMNQMMEYETKSMVTFESEGI